MRSFLHRNGLSIALLSMFIGSQAGLSLVGHIHYNDERKDHDQPQVTLVEYLSSGSYLEATMENWESEFLQMFAYVLLTAFLYQRGSAESKDPDKEEPVDRDPRLSMDKPDAPWPVRQGGYESLQNWQSEFLSIAVMVLLSIVLRQQGSPESKPVDSPHGQTGA